MKQWALAAIFVVALSGCHNPKNTEIPERLDGLTALKTDIDKLSAEERELLAGYVLRSSLSQGLVGAGELTHVPKGTTIAQAIEQQRVFLAQQKTERERQEKLKTELQQKKEQQMTQMREAVTVAVVSKKISPEVGRSGIVLDEKLEVDFAYRNNTQKQITGVKGRIVILDVFGDRLSAFQVSNDDTIPAGQSSVWPGSRSVRYATSGNQDRKWAELSEDKYTVVWEPEMIVFSDGTQLNSAP